MTIVWEEDGIYYRHDTKEEFETRVDAFAWKKPRGKKSRKKRK